MLQVTKNIPPTVPEEDTATGGVSLAETLTSLLAALRRQYAVFLALVSAALVLGLLYYVTTPPSYTATATMVIDPHKAQMLQQLSAPAETSIDAGTVLTQVEILKSQNIALSVIKELHLMKDPEFTGSGRGLIGAVVGALKKLFAGDDDTKSELQLQQAALRAFESRRSINRIGLTYAMEINFRSYDPDKSVRIANAIADAYIVDQLDAKYQATKRASVWLQDRINELRGQATAAQRAIVDFKQKNNLVDTGKGSVNEQQLAEINTQLVAAHATTAEAKARLDNIDQVMKQAIPDGSVADALKSEIIIKLRTQYLELAARESLWSTKYGPNHMATVNLRNQMLELRRNISDEMRKIAESYKNDYDVAKARENAIRSSLAASVVETQTASKAQVQLRELESNAQTYRSIYDSFLQRYMEAVQQQSFPITEARLIGPATRPLGRSQPKFPAVMGLSLIAGIMLSCGVAFIREMSDRMFRTAAQVESFLQVSCLALLPGTHLPGAPPFRLKFSSRMKATLFQPTHLSTVRAKSVFFASKGQTVSHLPRRRPETGQNHPRPDGTALASRQISTSPSMFRYVVDSPFSNFTEALRSVKVAMDLHGRVVQANKVVGFTSSLPNEGKSTVAANMAELIAHAGARAILIDCDLRNPSLSRQLAPGAEYGLLDVIAGRVDLATALWNDPASGLQFLPVGSTTKLIHTNEVLNSGGVKNLFARVRETYDYVIVDFAPLAPVVDTRTTTSLIDAYVYVIEWGQTRIDIVERNLASAPEIYERLLGVVLNKVDMNTIGRYERYGGNYHYYSAYGETA